MAAMTARKNALSVKDATLPFCKALVHLHQGKPVINSLAISREFLALKV
jgi:hypothetical protein